MTCPFLEYRTAADGKEFEVARAYCAAVEEFGRPIATPDEAREILDL